MRYILAGAKLGLTANAAFFTFAMLYAIEEATLKRVLNHLEETVKKAKDISEEDPDTSDDLK